MLSLLIQVFLLEVASTANVPLERDERGLDVKENERWQVGKVSCLNAPVQNDELQLTQLF